jgi:hypothetical protein
VHLLASSRTTFGISFLNFNYDQVVDNPEDNRILILLPDSKTFSSVRF